MYDFTKPKQKTLPVKLKNGKVIVLFPPNGYVLEAISEMHTAFSLSSLFSLLRQ